MRANMRARWALRVLLLLSLALLLGAVAGWAQQGSAPGERDSSGTSSDPQAKPREGSQAEESSSTQQAAKAPANTIPRQLQVRQIGRAGWLRRPTSPVHLGPVYVSSASFYQVMGQGLRLDPGTDRLTERTNTASVFSSNLVLDTQLRRSRVSFQYEPHLVIFNGQVVKDFSSHALSFDTNYMVSRHWTLTVNDTYSSSSNRMLYGDYLDVDLVSGRTRQSAFLETPRRSVTNYLQAAFDYEMNSRDHISIEPRFIYNYTTLGTTPAPSYTYGASISWNHALSRTRGFGLAYTLEQRTFSEIFPDTVFQTFGAGYSQQFSPTWWFNITGGAGTTGDRSGREWTITGSASLLKTFRRSVLSLAYHRTNDLVPLLTHRFSDRADVIYGFRVKRRWDFGAGLGHHRLNSVLEKISGMYATAQANCRLTRSITWFVTYGHRFQRGDSREVVTGRRNHFATGLRWEGRNQRGRYE